MKYAIEFKPQALKDMKALPIGDCRRIIAKTEALSENLAGDVKKLTNFVPEYRLRVGKYRVLFEVDLGTVLVYRILRRKDAYS